MTKFWKDAAVTTLRTITIFEGPDGGGKSMAAKTYARSTGAVYTHFANLPSIGAGLARTYVEAMLPALLGYQDVVLDRCWISEVPYGNVFRGGQQRMTPMTRRMLDRLAMRCGAVVILCLPGEDTAVANFTARQSTEMLSSANQLREIYHLYATTRFSDLPVYLHNYNLTDVFPAASGLLQRLRMPHHPLDLRSAGNAAAKVLLVGEGFAVHKPQDALYQWPFASFDGTGCSQWLTQHLMEADIGEGELMWVNADQLTHQFQLEPHQTVVALGDEASKALGKLYITHQQVPHPQYWKRFKAGEAYPLAATIKELL